MTGPETEAMRRRVRSTAAALVAHRRHQRRQLVVLGNGLAAQFAELERDFTPERAERLLHNLDGACAYIRSLSAAQEVAR